MEKQVKGLLEQWESIRENSLSFIENLTDDELNKKLPRKGLDTIRKHLTEMAEVEKDYVHAVESSVMDFNGPADSDISGNTSKSDLTNMMKEIDEELAKVLEKTNVDKEIVWFGEKKSIAYHLSGLIAHEALHVGQIIAFCYELNIEIPADIVEAWALSGK